LQLGISALNDLRDDLVTIIDSMREDGPKLVRMSEAAADALLRRTKVRPIEVIYYQPAFSPRQAPKTPPSGAGAPIILTVLLGGEQPASGVRVVAYTDIGARVGVAANTDSQGQATLHLGANPAQVQSLYIEPPPSGFWAYYRGDFTLSNGESISLTPVEPSYEDCVRRRHRPFAPDDGQGVKVAVIDSGIGPHPDLIVAAGRNTVTGEERAAFQDNGLGHGTHVAGIIAGRPDTGFPYGIAPAAQLWSGRVYPQGEDKATNYSIMKAMMLAAEGECDLLNLSLSSDERDEAVEEAVRDAIHQGCVVFAATGNQGRNRVGYPAQLPGVAAVAAFGADSAYPPATPHEAEVGSPAQDGLFFASFSNYGPGVSFAGPGVGVVSSALQGGGYAVRSGTSMACAAVTGMAARLLAKDAALLHAPRDRSRSVAIQNMLQSRATRLGFGFEKEGSGGL
jgi:subtilisin